MGRGFSRIVAAKDDSAATMAQMRTTPFRSTSEEPKEDRRVSSLSQSEMRDSLSAQPWQPKEFRGVMPKMKSLEDLFVHLLKDIYYAEKQILKALPRMAEKAHSAQLRQALLHHLMETEGQVDRLEKVFALCNREPAGETSPAIEGILEEGEKDMKNADDPDVLDASMTADAQAVEHYEIARYGTLVAWANQLGWLEAATLMNQTLEEEYDADRTLTELAESKLNRDAT
jgi:ferritin-like metal-binding protein YciE